MLAGGYLVEYRAEERKNGCRVGTEHCDGGRAGTVIRELLWKHKAELHFGFLRLKWRKSSGHWYGQEQSTRIWGGGIEGTRYHLCLWQNYFLCARYKNAYVNQRYNAFHPDYESGGWRDGKENHFYKY